MGDIIQFASIEGSKKDTQICTFCGKSGSVTEVMISGPGGEICKECVERCTKLMGNLPSVTKRPRGPKDAA